MSTKKLQILGSLGNEVIESGSGNAVTSVTQSGNIITIAKDNTFAENIHEHSAEDITRGVLSIAKGGTGATTALDARENLGISYGATLPESGSEGQIFLQTGEGSFLDRIGAAPAGYGLGEIPRVSTDINTEMTNGYFRITSGTANYPFTHGAGHVRVYDANEAVQNVFRPPTGVEMVRYTNDGGITWVEEWVNPPMYVGTEYRTTERYNGKPVYVQLVAFGAMPNSTSKEINISEYGIADVVSFSGVGIGASYNIDLQCIPGVTEIYYSISTKHLGITTTTDRSGYSAYITIKYTKA